jgi:hypothetical protein
MMGLKDMDIPIDSNHAVAPKPKMSKRRKVLLIMLAVVVV